MKKFLILMLFTLVSCQGMYAADNGDFGFGRAPEEERKNAAALLRIAQINPSIIHIQQPGSVYANADPNPTGRKPGDSFCEGLQKDLGNGFHHGLEQVVANNTAELIITAEAALLGAAKSRIYDPHLKKYVDPSGAKADQQLKEAGRAKLAATLVTAAQKLLTEEEEALKAFADVMSQVKGTELYEVYREQFAAQKLKIRQLRPLLLSWIQRQAKFSDDEIRDSMAKIGELMHLSKPAPHDRNGLIGASVQLLKTSPTQDPNLYQAHLDQVNARNESLRAQNTNFLYALGYAPSKKSPGSLVQAQAPQEKPASVATPAETDGQIPGEDSSSEARSKPLEPTEKSEQLGNGEDDVTSEKPAAEKSQDAATPENDTRAAETSEKIESGQPEQEPSSMQIVADGLRRPSPFAQVFAKKLCGEDEEIEKEPVSQQDYQEREAEPQEKPAGLPVTGQPEGESNSWLSWRPWGSSAPEKPAEPTKPEEQTVEENNPEVTKPKQLAGEKTAPQDKETAAEQPKGDDQQKKASSSWLSWRPWSSSTPGTDKQENSTEPKIPGEPVAAQPVDNNQQKADGPWWWPFGSSTSKSPTESTTQEHAEEGDTVPQASKKLEEPAIGQPAVDNQQQKTGGSWWWPFGSSTAEKTKEGTAATSGDDQAGQRDN